MKGVFTFFDKNSTFLDEGDLMENQSSICTLFNKLRPVDLQKVDVEHSHPVKNRSSTPSLSERKKAQRNEMERGAKKGGEEGLEGPSTSSFVIIGTLGSFFDSGVFSSSNWFQSIGSSSCRSKG